VPAFSGLNCSNFDFQCSYFAPIWQDFLAKAFIRIHQDGLIHISQLADRFVKDPTEAAKPRRQVMVRILEVDAARRRIALSLKQEKQS
jgi:transcriptional accessory protein Tex/SPT6